jgi:hypothetical protein
MPDIPAPLPSIGAVNARLLQREALRKAARDLNVTQGPGLEDALARVSAEVTAEAVYQKEQAAKRGGGA